MFRNLAGRATSLDGPNPYYGESYELIGRQLEDDSMEDSYRLEVLPNMTLVVAIIARDGILVGADSLATTPHLVSMHGTKLHSDGRIVIGVAGDEPFCRRIVHKTRKPDGDYDPCVYVEALSNCAARLSRRIRPARNTSFLIAGYGTGAFSGSKGPEIWVCRESARFSPEPVSLASHAGIGQDALSQCLITRFIRNGISLADAKRLMGLALKESARVYTTVEGPFDMMEITDSGVVEVPREEIDALIAGIPSIRCEGLYASS